MMCIVICIVAKVVGKQMNSYVDGVEIVQDIREDEKEPEAAYARKGKPNEGQYISEQDGKDNAAR